jgi:hypothetical protein
LSLEEDNSDNNQAGHDPDHDPAVQAGSKYASCPHPGFF